MATITIDDQTFEVEDGENILQAVLGLGLDLPYFCWHPSMGSVGACRQCALVQYRDADDTQGRIVMGCMTPATDGARFSMRGPDATEFRSNIVESLMLNHPHDCPVCAEGGECHLQDMTVMVGHRNRSYRGKKNTHRNQDLGPLIHHEMNRCISCYRCTRYYNDYAGGTDLSAQAAHDHVYFGRHEDGTLESEFAGNLVEVCPTGVFTDKPLVNEYTRKWDLQSAPSVCSGCAVGCNVLPGERYGKLKRIHNRYNSQVNGYFLCDRGRFGGNFVNDEKRASFAGLRNSAGSYDAIRTDDALEQLTQWFADDQKVIGIGSPRASLESNYLLKQLVGNDHYCSGMADYETELTSRISQLLQQGSVATPSIKQVETADAVLVLGEDVTNTAPRLALALRQSVRNLAKQLAEQMNIPLWQDEAVRNLAQDRLSPLFIASMSNTPLDDVAEQTVHLPPTEIARLGFAIAAELNSELPAVADLDEETHALAKQIASALSDAQMPLIVSGTGAQSQAIIDAAYAICDALKNQQAMLSYCLPESNSMGLALAKDEQQLSLTEVMKLAKGGNIDTLVVVENDLYRRAESSQIDGLLANVNNLVVIDSNETPTLSKSNLALPAATIFESEGTLVNNEGRAQRHYPVFQAAEQRQPSYTWLLQLGKALELDSFDSLDNFDSITMACAACDDSLAEIGQASPSADFRDRGMKVPRQTHRYSGRTAMRSNISVHEPKQPVDEDTPFSFSMEGTNSGKSGALIPFVWSPGWNSNQSLHKFQSEAGGDLNGGTPGVRLINNDNSGTFSKDYEIPEKFEAPVLKVLLLPVYRIFGSDELSAMSPAIKQLCPTPFIQINSSDAEQMGLSNGDVVITEFSNKQVHLSVEINDSIPTACAGYGMGLTDSEWLAPNTIAILLKMQADGDADV